MLKFNKSNANSGISLIEVIITITILVIGVLSLVKIFPVALQAGQIAKQTTIAANLAQAKIEELFYLDYDNIPLGAIETKHRLSDNPQNPFYYYQRQTEVEYVDSELNYSALETGMKKITVTTFWRSPILAREKNVELKTIISQK